MIKLNWNYLLYFFVLILFAILHNVYYKYIFTCKEYFMQCDADDCTCIVPHYTPQQNQNKQNTCVSKKNAVAELYKLRNFIDASISTRNQATGITPPIAGGAKNEEVPGQYVPGMTLDIDTSDVDEDNPQQNKKCSYKRWIKADINDVDRDLLISTIPKLEAKINFELQKLRVQRATLLQSINERISILTEGIDDQFQGKCDTQCTAIQGSGCDVFCETDDMTLEEETTRNKEYIDSKNNELEHSLCEYIKQYYFIVDLNLAQKEYTDQLKEIYTDESISEATQKRGFSTVYLAEDIVVPDDS